MDPTIVTRIRAIAREHGYAIGVHGSMMRDLDLIAVPWVEAHSSADELVGSIEQSLDLVTTRQRVEKPCGRLGYILHGARWRKDGEPQPIDLSVIP